MENSSVQAAQAALQVFEPQAQEAERKVLEHQRKLDEVTEQWQRLRRIVDDLKALLPEAPTSDALHGPSSSDSPDLDSQDAHSDLDGDDAAYASGVTIPHVRRKVRSTQMVAEIVTEADHQPVHRDEVLQIMEARGATEAMQNPRNALNAALTRAVEKKLINQVGLDTFARITRPD